MDWPWEDLTSFQQKGEESLQLKYNLKIIIQSGFF
jgi:hypothetical protein